nr:hypothetical protein [Tanacetum cinerariifolium]
MTEMFPEEHALDYSPPPLYVEYDDDLFEVESDTEYVMMILLTQRERKSKIESDAENVYDDPFDSKGEKIKQSKLLIDELDLSCDFLHPFEYDSFISQDFSRVDALPSTNNEDKIFNPGPSRLCAQAQSGDDTPFHKQACMEYIQLVFCKLFEKPRERHLACPTKMHGFRLLSFQGYVLNHGLIPPPDHLFGGDTG